MSLDRLEGALEAVARLAVDRLDRFLQRGGRFVEVALLRRQEGEARLEVRLLLDRHQIHGADGFDV